MKSLTSSSAIIMTILLGLLSAERSYAGLRGTSNFIVANLDIAATSESVSVPRITQQNVCSFVYAFNDCALDSECDAFCSDTFALNAIYGTDNCSIFPNPPTEALTESSDTVGCAEGDGYRIRAKASTHRPWYSITEERPEATGQIDFYAMDGQCPHDSFSATCEISAITRTTYKFLNNNTVNMAANMTAETGMTALGTGPRVRFVAVLYVNTKSVVPGSRPALLADASDGGDFVDGEFSASFDIVPLVQEFRLLSADYLDEQFDLDSDDDFDADDLGNLQDLAPDSTNLYLLRRLDLDGDSVVESDEMEVMEVAIREILIAQLTTSVFGDSDGDSDVDCDDLDEAFNHDDTILGQDAAYLPELDFNLDGSISQSEVGQLFHHLVPGDANWDKLVSFPDITFILVHWNETPPAFTSGDVNGDGGVDFADYILVLAEWGTDNCP